MKLESRKKLYRPFIEYIVSKGGQLVSSYQLKEKFNISEAMEATPLTRKILKEAMREICVEEGIPIGATSQGYFVITKYSEMKKYRDSLQGRINGLEERISIVVEAWNNSGGQSLDGPIQESLFDEQTYD